jgi:hypothetical protein
MYSKAIRFDSLYILDDLASASNILGGYFVVKHLEFFDF